MQTPAHATRGTHVPHYNDDVLRALVETGDSECAALCRVLVRVRPLAKECTHERCLEPQSQTSLHIRAERGHLFNFDQVQFIPFAAPQAQVAVQLQRSLVVQREQVLGEEATQEDAYAAAMQGVVQDLRLGINASVIAYGQTGACAAFSAHAQQT